MKHFVVPTFLKQMVQSAADLWRRLILRRAVVVAEPRIRKPRVSRDPDKQVSWYFRGAILDKLDEYFVILNRMRKSDRAGYDLYSRVGARLIPFGLYIGRQLSPWWLKEWPAFGAVAFGVDPYFREGPVEGRILVPKLMYFQKFAPRKVSSTVQPATGQVYLVTVYWDDPEDAKLFGNGTGWPTTFPVAVSPMGEVRVLKLLMSETIPTRQKTRGHRGKIVEIPHKSWKIPGFFEHWAKAHNETAQDYLKFMFLAAANTFELTAADSMVNVRVNKANVSAVFSIEPKRSSYFFRDRETTLNEKGAKRRIFHIVRAHERDRNGVKSPVRIHFRGEREFDWNGYRVNITVPGMHHVNLAEFNIGAIDEEHTNSWDKDVVDMKDLAVKLRQHMSKERELRDLRARA